MGTFSKAYDETKERIEQMFDDDNDLAEELAVEHLFCSYILNFLEHHGLGYRGQSIKYQGWSTLLVLKVVKDDLPYVGFFTERTTTRCMGLAVRKIGEGTVNWQKDKFA